MLGRVSGMFREITLARAFGVSAEADAAILLLTLPDLMIALLLAGGLGAALIPQLKRLAAADQIVLFRKTVFAVVIFFAAISAVLTLNVDFFVTLFAPGMSTERLKDFDITLLLVGACIPIAAASGVFASFLNSRERFVVPAAGTLIFNGCLCFYFLFIASLEAGILGVGFAVLAAVSLRLIWKMVVTREVFKPVVMTQNVSLRSIAPAFLNALGATIVITGIPILFRSLTSYDGAGAIAIFNYIVRFYELALLILIAPLTTILLPYLSRLHAEKAPEFEQLLATGFKITLIATITAVVAYYSTGLFFVELLFSLANLPAENTQQIYDMGRYLFLAIPFFSLSQILSVSQFATGTSSRVLTASLLAALVTIATYISGIHVTLEFPIIGFISLFNAVYFVLLLMRFDFRNQLLSKLKDDFHLLQLVLPILLLAGLVFLGLQTNSIILTLPLTVVTVAAIAFFFRKDIRRLKSF